LQQHAATPLHPASVRDAYSAVYDRFNDTATCESAKRFGTEVDPLVSSKWHGAGLERNTDDVGPQRGDSLLVRLLDRFKGRCGEGNP
jgi:hypothetical protein